MTINSNGVCSSCGRDFDGEIPAGVPCPETDDCPSHIEEKGLVWWGQTNQGRAESVAKLVDSFAEEQGTVEEGLATNIQDIITNLHHLAEGFDLDWEAIVRMADINYEGEGEGEGEGEVEVEDEAGC